ncbi:MAG: thiamine-phosphate kinase [Actinomycetaceae bacterium]|nr:thiamine-phosphate kinase [Actinomycetaceae bacterium]
MGQGEDRLIERMGQGEDRLIERMREALPFGERTLLWSGDDCAEISAPEGHVLVTTDVLVEGRHFLTDWSAPGQIGRRAAAQNLADIAAQGGVPSAFVVSMVVPDNTDTDWLLDVVSGFGAEVAPTGAGVVGGDLSGGSQFSIAVTALGYAPHGPVRRSGARPGDIIAVAGTLGMSAAGFELLRTEAVAASLHSEEALGDWYLPVSTYRVPRPPLRAGVAAAASGATAMMDISDGLSIDLARMAKASNVMMDLYPQRLQEDVARLLPAARKTGKDAWQWVLHGGEDHAMLATFPPDTILPTPFRVIGGVGTVGQDTSSRIRIDGQPLNEGGWDHFN